MGNTPSTSNFASKRLSEFEKENLKDSKQLKKEGEVKGENNKQAPGVESLFKKNDEIVKEVLSSK